MPTPGEHKAVQARILEYAEAIGWTLVSQKAVFVSRLRRAKVSYRRCLNRKEHKDRKEDLERSIWPRAAAKSSCLQFWHRLWRKLATGCHHILDQVAQARNPAPEIP